MDQNTQDGLRDLEDRIQRDLDDLAYPARKWVIPRTHPSDEHVWNVVILGAGMSGLAVGFGLRRERIDNFLIVDRAERGLEGPWPTYARMRTLRTDKMQSSIDCGIPNLHFNKYYEARFGREAWDELVRCPTSVWMDYLNWYRRFLDLPVENEIEVVGVDPEDGLLRVQILRRGARENLLTRKLVIATGYDGAGGPNIPRLVSSSLPPELYAHSTDMIDFGPLEGKTVGVIGCGSSAFDNASTALEAGATVHMLARTPLLELPKIMRTVEYAGLKNNFHDMPSLMRWRFACHIMCESAPPPAHSIQRAEAFDGFSMHLDCRIASIERQGAGMRVETSPGGFDFDYLICGTGFRLDATTRSEFGSWTNEIALWRDRFTPLPEDAEPALEKAAYLGPGFELTAKDPARAPHLRHIHDFSWGAWPSMGPITAGVSGMPFGLKRLLPALSKALFLEDIDLYWEDAKDWTPEELRRGQRER